MSLEIFINRPSGPDNNPGYSLRGPQGEEQVLASFKVDETDGELVISLEDLFHADDVDRRRGNDFIGQLSKNLYLQEQNRNQQPTIEQILVCPPAKFPFAVI